MKVILILLFTATALVCRSGPLSPAKTPSTSTEPAAPLYFSPAALAVSADGGTLFIAGATANQLVWFNTVRSEIVRRVDLPGSPSGLALSADGSRLYVACAAPESSVCIIATASGKRIGSIPCGHTAMAPVLSRDEKNLVRLQPV